MHISDHISVQIIALLFIFSFAFASSKCSSVSYRIDNMKKETMLNVRLKSMRFDEAICEAENNNGDTDTDKSS